MGNRKIKRWVDTVAVMKCATCWKWKQIQIGNKIISNFQWRYRYIRSGGYCRFVHYKDSTELKAKSIWYSDRNFSHLDRNNKVGIRNKSWIHQKPILKYLDWMEVVVAFSESLYFNTIVCNIIYLCLMFFRGDSIQKDERIRSEERAWASTWLVMKTFLT